MDAVLKEKGIPRGDNKKHYDTYLDDQKGSKSTLSPPRKAKTIAKLPPVGRRPPHSKG